MRLGIDLRCLTEGEQGGIATYTRELTRRLPSYLDDFSCVGFTSGMTVPEPAVAFPVVRRRWPNKWTNLTLATIRRPAIDALCPADVFFAPTPKYLALRRTTPFVLTVHDVSFIDHPEYFTARQQFWHRWLRFGSLVERATALIAVSAHTAADLVAAFPSAQGKVHVIPSGADHVPPGPHQPVPDLPARYQLAFAPPEARKNVATLVAAHRQVFSVHGVPLVLVGLAAKQYDGPGTISRPYLEPAMLWRALANAQLFLYPSVYEGFGFPPLEAMQLGVPVVASHVTSLPAVLGDAALFVDPWDPTDLARAATTLLQDDILRAQYARAGRAWAKQFTWDACAKATATCIRSTTPYAHRH